MSARPFDNLVFVAFGNSPEWDFARIRLNLVLKKSFPHANRFIVDQNWLFKTSLYRENESFFHENRRGYGLWTWKPLLIKEALALYPKCEYVVYLDMGCDLNINAQSLKRFNEYLNIARQENALAFDLPWRAVDWSAQNVIEYFDASQATQNVVIAGVLILKNNMKIHSLLEEWFSLMTKDNFSLAVGGIETSLQLSSNHRHDQSILSFLWHRYNLPCIPDETYLLSHRKFDSDKPIWTSRNREFFGVARSSALRQLSRITRKCVIYLRLKLRTKLQKIESQSNN